MNKKYVFVTALLILGPFLAYAWTSAPPNPPAGNIGAPIDQGATAQSKIGGLLLNTGGATDGLIVQFGKVGIGTTTPGQKLDVAGNVNIAANSAYMYNGANVIIAQPERDNYFLGNAGNLTTMLTTTGSRNTASGYRALYSITLGYNNTANGMDALYSNTAGHSNTANGVYALKYNTTGYGNTAIGGSALFFNTTGSENTATGYNTLASNTSGSQNTANGQQALNSNTTGSYNNAFGYWSLFSNQTGSGNNAIGWKSLSSNTIGDSNVAIGTNALRYSTTGSTNTGVGGGTLYVNTTGFSNTAVGAGGLETNTTGSNNTAVGYRADVASGALTNATAIGNGAIVNASNKVMIGNTSVTSIGGQVGWSVFSDERLKKNIKESPLGLDFILKLKPVTFNYKAVGQGDIAYTGLIAQDVEKVLRELRMDFSGMQKPQNEDDFYQLRYAEFITPLIKSVQEQQKKIDDQQKQIDELRQEIRDLKNDLYSW